jgi:hypothetical protein
MRIEEVKNAIKELSPNDLLLFRKWFSEFDANFRESNTQESTIEERLKHLQGSLRGKGLLKAFMDEKKYERDL